jgi:hypothetical protein
LKVLNSCENSVNTSKTKAKILSQNLVNLGMLQTTTLKRNLVPEIGEARKKVGFWVT